MRVDPNYVVKLSSFLDESNSVQAQLTAELSSGLRVSSPSTDPVAAAQSSILNSVISQADTYVQTAAGVSSRLQTTDSALGEVVAQLTSAITVAVKGSNSTLNPANIASIQQELIGVRDSVLGLANTSYAGTYLFSGSQGTTKPFSINTVPSPATTTYAGDAQVQSIVTPTGQSIQVNLPGSSVFTGVLSALNQVIADFTGASASATVSVDTAALTTALGQVSSQRSILGSSLNKLQSTSSYAQTQASNASIAQSALVSSDPAAVATQLSANETQHQALLSVISGLQQKTDLFGYIR